MKQSSAHHPGNPGHDPEFTQLAMRLSRSADDQLSHCTVPKDWVILDINADRHGLLKRLTSRLIHGFKRIYWRRRFQNFGSGSRIEFPNWIKSPEFISIGRNVSLWRHARLSVVNPEATGPVIRIGDGTAIHPHVHISAASSVDIGRNVLFAANCYITDHDHDWLDPNDPPRINKRVIVAPTSIGDYTWLGEKVSVLKGVRIGNHCVIGANSVVTSDIPPYSVAVGSPARVVRRWDHARGAWVKALSPDEHGDHIPLHRDAAS